MIIRSLIFLLPLGLWVGLYISNRLTVKTLTASFLTFVWVFNIGLIANALLLDIGIWDIAVSDNLFYGVPLDWLFSLATICGALIPLGFLLDWSLTTRLVLNTLALLAVYAAIGITPDSPVHILGLSGMILVCSLPAVYLSYWTALGEQALARSILQSLAWVVLLYWLFPSVVFHFTYHDWSAPLQRSLLENCLYFAPLLLPAWLLISALKQFAVEGEGTAFPYDPPLRLVRGGIYRYLSNPMQVGICLSMIWWGVAWQSAWLSVAGLIAIVLFIVFKDVCNGSCAIGKNNPEWLSYQQTVRKWIPKFNSR